MTTKHKNKSTAPFYKKKHYFLYLLSFSPGQIDNIDYYIGISSNPSNRLISHLSDKWDKKASWEFKIVKFFENPVECCLAEIATIAHYKEQGYTLLNKNPGGTLPGMNAKQRALVKQAKQTT